MSNYTPLTDDEVDLIAQSVWAQHASRSDRQDLPTLILVGGQSGAGKTAASNWAKLDLSTKGGFVHIDTDAFHAQVEEIKKENLASTQTHEDCRKIAMCVLGFAMNGGRNVLEEGVFRRSGILEDRLESAQKLGYRCEIIGIATSRETSRLSVLERREEFRKHYGYIRDVPEEKQDQGFNGFTENFIKSAAKYDRVRVVNRDGELLYDNVGNGKYRSVAEAMEEGRRLTDQQICKLSERWNGLLQECIAKNIPSDELARVHESRTKFEAFASSEKHIYGQHNASQNGRVLACDSRFALHSDKELAKAAFYRGVCEKDHSFRGKTPDFAAIDALLADRDTLAKLPDVELKTIKIDRVKSPEKDKGLEL